MSIALNMARIVQRLQNDPRGWCVDDLCEELEIQPRTYRKYRKILQEQFKPWLHRGRSLLEEVGQGSGKTLRLASPLQEPKAIGELVSRLTAYHLARKVLGALGEGKLRGALDDAFQSFFLDQRRRRLAVLGRLERDLSRLVHYVPYAPKDYSGKQKVLETILRCLVHHRVLSIDYEAALQSGLKTHTLEPLTLAMHQGGLYLFARFPKKKKVYNFAVDRILAAQVQEDYFSYPPPKEYHPAKHTARSFGIFLEESGRARHQVELVFADVHWLQVYLRERTWHATQTFKTLRGGRLRMTFQVTSLAEVVPWVRRFGPDVQVRSPAQLRKQVAGEA